MKILTSLLMIGLLPCSTMSAQTVVSPLEARTAYVTLSPSRVSVHDPSVVWDEQSQQYYIFGTHRAQARSKDLYRWTAVTPSVPWGRVSGSGALQQVTASVAFNTPQVTQVMKGGKKVDFPAFNAKEWAAASTPNYNIDGNQWAPDVIYNKEMKKWCQYLSINGDHWASSIVLLTADKITGPYVYQGPVVISGFNGTNTNDYKKTDLEIVLGQQTSLPARYRKGENWGRTWPNNIDPCVFYDEQGRLWMTYGSWSGGIFALQLDEKTGLRDYDVTYPLTGSGENYSSDPYFGKKIAGGYYVSGEGSYVKHIGNYYYLFMSYGYLSSDGGYEMEVFRSENPDGPYVDPKGTSAVFSSYVMNYGTTGRFRGAKIFGPYADWGLMAKGTAGELAQGHNSATTDDRGRSFLVYHTRFNNGGEGFQNRVHQLFTNQNGWLVAAPFEFTGETVNDDSIRTHQRFSAEEVAGTYQVMVHKQGMDYKNREVVRPASISLLADGTVKGAYSGSWQLVPGTSYMNLTIAGQRYQGVVVKQQMEPTTIKAIAFTGQSSSGTSVWAYKMEDRYRLAYLYRNELPVSKGMVVNRDLNLKGLAGDGVEVEWTSSNEAVLSANGTYNAAAMTAETMPVDLTMKLRVGRYELTDVFNVEVRRSADDYWTGARAYYPFDAQPLANAFNTAETAALRHGGTAQQPTLVKDEARSGMTLHTAFGAAGQESYVEIPNSLKGSKLDEGFTLSFWVKRGDDNLWDALFSIYDATAQSRLYITGNTYVGYNNGKGNWIDLNHSDGLKTGNIPVGKWTLATLTVSRKDGIKLYVDGKEKTFTKTNGSQNGSAVSAPNQFGCDEIVDLAASSPHLYLGYGSFWGSAHAYFDDLMVFDRVLAPGDIASLYAAETAGHDFTGIAPVNSRPRHADRNIYNLHGQRVGTSLDGLPRGVYIQAGKKVMVR